MIDDCYINNLAKIEVCAVFHSGVIGEVFHPNVQSLAWRSHVGAPRGATIN